MSISCEELIRRVRAAKSSAAADAVIQTELAAIRTAFKQRDQPYIARNVAKCMFASMSGYRVDWAHMGVINLCSSARTHQEKRLAYLALSTIVSQDSPYIRMATQSIKSDLDSGSQYRASIALSAVGSVGTPEILSELSSSIAALAGPSTSIYLRKKALLVATRCVETCKDLTEQFIEVAAAAMEDKAHSIVLTGCDLALAVMKNSPEFVTRTVGGLYHLSKVLANLNLTRHSSDHSMGQVCDPMLQVALLRFLTRVIQLCIDYDLRLPDDFQVHFPDVLEAIVTTGCRKGESVTARVSIQFEAARTVLQLPHKMFGMTDEQLSDLRASAADALTEAIVHENQSVRYSALASLVESIRKTGESAGAQRHRSLVLQCMGEPSITLRRRALNLLVLLVDTESSEPIVSDLMDLLATSPDEQGNVQIVPDALNMDIKAEIISAICFLVDRFAEDPKWHFDVLRRLLTIQGSGPVNSELVNSIVACVQREGGVQAYAALQMSEVILSVKKDPSQLLNESLLASALYLVGEFSPLLGPSLADTVKAIEFSSGHKLAANSTRRHAVSALGKISAKAAPRAGDSEGPVDESQVAIREAARSALVKMLTNTDPETQQRAYEYVATLAEPKAAGLLGSVPAPPRPKGEVRMSELATRKEREARAEQRRLEEQAKALQSSAMASMPSGASSSSGVPAPSASVVPSGGFANFANFANFASMAAPLPAPQQAAEKNKRAAELLDLLGLGLGDASGSTPTPAAPAAPAAPAVPAVPPAQPPAQPVPPDAVAVPAPYPADLLGVEGVPPPPAPSAPIPAVPATPASEDLSRKLLFSDDYISVFYQRQPPPPESPGWLAAQFLIVSSKLQTKSRLQYAVHASTQLKVEPASGDITAVGKPPIRQTILLKGENTAVKVKLQYILPGGQVRQQMLMVQKL